MKAKLINSSILSPQDMSLLGEEGTPNPESKVEIGTKEAQSPV